MSDNPTEGWRPEARLRFEAEAMRLAPSGQDTPGTFHLGNWQDKPHRVLYDACRLMEEAADEIARLEKEIEGLKRRESTTALEDLLAGLLAKATPGEWSYDDPGCIHFYNDPDGGSCGGVPFGYNEIVAFGADEDDFSERQVATEVGGDDAEFFVACRTHLPAVLKALSDQRAEIESLTVREKICQSLVLLHQGDKDHVVSGLDAALIVLREIQEACLFVDDDDRGTIRVSSEPYLEPALFDRLCTILREHRLSKCPDCGSYNPQLYPSGQAYGREPTCQHWFHKPAER